MVSPVEIGFYNAGFVYSEGPNKGKVTDKYKLRLRLQYREYVTASERIGDSWYLFTNLGRTLLLDCIEGLSLVGNSDAVQVYPND